MAKYQLVIQTDEKKEEKQIRMLIKKSLKKGKNKMSKKSKVKEKHSAEKEFLSIMKGNVNIPAPILS